MTIIVSIINHKGGVGKSTTSINLVAELARRGFRVLLVDLDYQANATRNVGVDSEACELVIDEVLVNQRDLKEIILPIQYDGIQWSFFLAPANKKLKDAKRRLYNISDSHTILGQALSKLNYDFIIIDCRPDLDVLEYNAIYASNFFIVPCEMGVNALDGLSDIMDTVIGIKNDSFKIEKSFRILLNKFDVRKSYTNKLVFDELEDFKELVFDTPIRWIEVLNQSHFAKIPIVAVSPKGESSREYQKLTNEFLKLCHPSRS